MKSHESVVARCLLDVSVLLLRENEMVKVLGKFIIVVVNVLWAKVFIL